MSYLKRVLYQGKTGVTTRSGAISKYCSNGTGMSGTCKDGARLNHCQTDNLVSRAKLGITCQELFYGGLKLVCHALMREVLTVNSVCISAGGRGIRDTPVSDYIRSNSCKVRHVVPDII